MEKELSHQEKISYLPPAGKHWLLPLYDPLSRLFGIDAYRDRCLKQANLASHHYVLDVGCGTGSLMEAIVQGYPFECLFGVDPDDNALRFAVRKLRRTSNVQIKSGFADQLDFPDHFFHRVFSTFVFHHLTRQEQVRTLTEICRVLKPGGLFNLLDFDHWNPHKHGRSNRSAHPSPAYAQLLKQCGFTLLRERKERHLFLGRISFFVASI
ncbi:class I SAM-dependent methyltransferase [Chryseolinea sp. H1M3-3]|uniref:class I SAM-dependent methyltransferase n=1 Tax=Chryseolinea sp. H1M3-3 TaxID=3034144 RepID=UPI0023ECE300|nr:class I SAM-dependent methyltransferase [Chryseolinea sp. H1M3-3]